MGNITRSGVQLQSAHMGFILHGYNTRNEYVAPLKNEANAAKVFQGSVVSLDSNGEFVCGLAGGTSFNYPVPMIALKNNVDPDVRTGMSDSNNWRQNTVSALGDVITAIPCTAGYEIETTEFVTGTSVSYAYNDALTAADSTDIGKVKKITKQLYLSGGTSQPVLGFVSKPPAAKKDYFNNRMAFFTTFIPAAN